MSTPAIAGLHLVRFGTAADQDYFLGDFTGTYDQIVVNANIIAHMPSAMATFLAVRAKKPFFIDPQTHGFQHGVDHLLSTSRGSDGEIKRAWQKVIDAYEGPVAQALKSQDRRPVLPEDFDDTTACRAFCRNVVEFQTGYLSNQLKTGPDAKYIKYVLDEEGGCELVAPSLVVAPYFFLNAQFFADWSNVNLRCLQFTREALQQGNLTTPLAAQVVLSQEVLLSEKLRADLIRKYRNDPSKPQVFLIWIDRFTEQELSDVELLAYVDLVQQLAGDGREVVNLYGGYYSVAAARFGKLKLIGICHGLEYGESKPVIPISGGVPVAKYYVPAVHSRFPPRVAIRAIRALGADADLETFRSVVCNCKTCSEIVDKEPSAAFKSFAETKASTFWRSGKRVAMEFPTARASDLCTRHYLWCKHREYTEQTTLDDVCRSLSSAYQKLKAAVSQEYVGHCKIWPEVLRSAK